MGMRAFLAATAVTISMTLAPGATAAVERPATSYYILAGAGKRDAQVSMEVRGAKVTRGYVLDEGARCAAFPELGGYFIDFGSPRIRDGRFRDLDRGGDERGPIRKWRDVTSGVIDGDRVRGRAKTATKFEDAGWCRFSQRFTLERVDRKRWLRYTKLERKIDPAFNSDGRVAPDA